MPRPGYVCFQTLSEVRERSEDWTKKYNEKRPHDSLNDLTLEEVVIGHQQAKDRYLQCFLIHGAGRDPSHSASPEGQSARR